MTADRVGSGSTNKEPERCPLVLEGRQCTMQARHYGEYHVFGVGAVPADEPTPREALTQREEDMAATYQRIIDGSSSIRQPVIDEATSHVEYLTAMSHSWIINGDEHHGAMLQALCIAHGWMVEDLAAAERRLAAVTELPDKLEADPPLMLLSPHNAHNAATWLREQLSVLGVPGEQ